MPIKWSTVNWPWLSTFRYRSRKTKLNHDVWSRRINSASSPIEGTLQKVKPAVLRLRVLHRCHNSLLVGHPEECRMYDTTRQKFCWPLMANGSYATIKAFRSCAQNRQTNNNKRRLRPRWPSRHLLYVAMDRLSLLPKKTGNLLIVFIADQYPKLTMVISTARIFATSIATIFVGH